MHESGDITSKFYLKLEILSYRPCIEGTETACLCSQFSKYVNKININYNMLISFFPLEVKEFANKKQSKLPWLRVGELYYFLFISNRYLIGKLKGFIPFIGGFSLIQL